MSEACKHPRDNRVRLTDNRDNAAFWCRLCGALSILDEFALEVFWLKPEGPGEGGS